MSDGDLSAAEVWRLLIAEDKLHRAATITGRQLAFPVVVTVEDVADAVALFGRGSLHPSLLAMLDESENGSSPHR